ncbi:MAG: class I SAM-dependent methyltransferase family protein, partial [Candidatus Riflebacteria bacterium]|nr:class I SAM-dependent methyltransferase family protein [Candidatus Riflebacteria bacterium]
NLEQMLSRVVRSLGEAGRRLHILDIASGPGRYVLETIKGLEPLPVTATLRDYKTVNVEAGQRLAKELGLECVKVERGDAFDQEALAAIQPRPTVGIVSGLFELFPMNQRLLQSLRGLFDAIEPGGYLIYTNQPWHPQLELIARSLGNREGDAWVMRRRTQAEMDALVEACGFVKVEQQIDAWGIFSVSLARRP